MLIRRLPQPSLSRKCLTFIFGQKVVPVIETVNVVADNMRLGYNMQHNPAAYERLLHLYQVRYLSEYQRALKKGLVPEKKPIPECKVPVHITGMVTPGQRVTWTT